MSKKTRKHQYTIAEKKKIANEAYSRPKNITLTAEKYCVHRSNVIRWKDNIRKYKETSNKNPKKESRTQQAEKLSMIKF